MYVIADMSVYDQKLYSFDSTDQDAEVDWRLVKLDNLRYRHDGAILLDADVLLELAGKGVPIFHEKKSAKKAYHKLGLTTCRYVELVLEASHEYQTHDMTIESKWTQLNPLATCS